MYSISKPFKLFFGLFGYILVVVNCRDIIVHDGSDFFGEKVGNEYYKYLSTKRLYGSRGKLNLDRKNLISI